MPRQFPGNNDKNRGSLAPIRSGLLATTYQLLLDSGKFESLAAMARFSGSAALA